MSDEPDLTPEQERRVRRLLADARHDETVPDTLADRLDRVLAELGTQADDGRDRVAPVDLASRRRRRATRMLVAAAAVVVVGVGIGQLVGTRDDDAGGTSSSAEADDAGSGAFDRSSAADAPEADSASPGQSPEQAPSLGAAQGQSSAPPDPAGTRPGRVSARSFTRDVVRYQDAPGFTTAAGDRVGSEDLSDRQGFMCGAADFGSGKLVAVRYDGTPAVLAYRPAPGDSQVVDLLQCGSGDTLRSVTIPLP